MTLTETELNDLLIETIDELGELFECSGNR